MRRSLLLLFCFIVQLSFQAQSPARPDSALPDDNIVEPAVNTAPTPVISGNSSLFSDLEFVNTLIISLLFLIITLFVLFRKRTDSLSGEEYVRLIGIMLVIFGALFVLAAGWSKEHAAPVFGLLGTIIGFLLGRQSNRSDAAE